MADNLMNKDHKATNDAYREGYDRIFGYNRRTSGKATKHWWLGITVYCPLCMRMYCLGNDYVGRVESVAGGNYITCLCGNAVFVSKEKYAHRK